jgi:hypothetical protein
MKKQFIIYILLTNLFSQSFTDLTPRPSYDINKIDTPITIDGQLDEESWGLAQIATGFTDTNVFQGEPAAFKTEVKLLYDDSNLYVAFIAYTPPEKIRTSLSKRDNLNGDDWVVIDLDLFGDESLIYGIGANPSGVQIDGRSGFRFDTSLDLIFDVKTSTTDYGYIVEFAIPFSSLRYSVGKSQDWRINFTRGYTTDDEFQHMVVWASKIQGIECQSCQMAFLNGIEPPKQGAGNIEYIPSLVAGYSEDFNNDSTSDNVEPSLFIKYPISSVDLLEIAINPDFSQIESDDIQNDVNTVNALHFKERRPFFSEGAELFRFQPQRGYLNLFYSRTINDPSVTVKYTGKIGKTSYGLISAKDESSPLILPFEEFSTVLDMGESTSNILRIKHQLKNASSIGAIITNRTFDKGGDMTTGGIDFHYHPGKNLHLTLHAAASIHNEPDSLSTIFDDNPYTFDNHTAKFDGEEITGNALGFGLSKMTRTDVTSLTVRLRSPGFRTSNGFETNNSTKWMKLSKGKNIFYDNHPRLLASGHAIEMVYKTNYDGDVKSQGVDFGNQFVFLNGYQIELGIESENELFNGVQFNNMLEVAIAVTGKPNAKTTIHGGIVGENTIIRYLNIPEQTDLYGTWGYVEYKVSDQASTGIGIQYQDAKNYYDGFIINSWYTHSFTSKLSLRTKVQYSDFSHNWFVEPLLTYQPSAFSALYVGINDLLTTDDNMFSNLKESERQFFIKFQYLL